MAISYAGNRYWTFRHRQRAGVRRESIRYAVLYGTGLVIQFAYVALTVSVLARHGMPAGETALLIGIGLGAVFRWWCCREWVWPRRYPMPGVTQTIMN